MKEKTFNCILILALIGSSLILALDMMHLFTAYHPYLRVIVFMTSILVAIYQIEKANFYLGVIFITLAFIYNPIIVLKVEKTNWFFVHLSTIFCMMYQMILVLSEKENEKMASIAYQLDTYLREIERILSNQSYYQSLMYLKKKHPENFMIEDESYRWRTQEIPHFLFFIETSFYLPGRDSKGGISAQGLDQFQSLEIHCNFNLTRAVKSAVTLKTSNNIAPTKSAKLLTKILKERYHYLEFKKNDSTD